jgi:DHA1 family bicyclomycin/chloramphenicol resistance-like MFS transporter
VAPADIQFSLAALTFGLAGGQLIFGAVSDRVGRRIVLIPGAAVFTVCAALIPLVPRIEALIAIRFVQGLAVAAALIVARAVVRDLYDRNQAAKLFAYLFMALGTVPIVGPPIAGLLTEHFGWEAVFAMMAAVGAAVFLANLLFLKETLTQKDPEATRVASIGRSFATILSHRTFQIYGAIAATCYGGLFAILAAMSPVLIGFMGQTPAQFGVQFALTLTGHLVASYIAGRVVERTGINRLIVPGAALCAVSGIAGAGMAAAGIAVPMAIIGPSFAFMVGFAFVVAPAMAGALSPFATMTGRASSLLGFVQMGAGGLVMAAIGALDDGTQVPLIAALAATGIACLALCAALPRAKYA